MMKTTTYNGVIRKFDLVINNFGIFTFNLVIESKDGIRNYGNYKFSCGKLAEFVRDLMCMLEVTEAYEITNSAVRYGYDEYSNFRIGHLFKDEWIVYSDYMKG